MRTIQFLILLTLCRVRACVSCACAALSCLCGGCVIYALTRASLTYLLCLFYFFFFFFFFVEVVAHSLRDVLTSYKSSDMALLKIDFKNAFNLMDRNAFVRASSQMFPGLERWTRWCYSQSPLLVYDHAR